MREEAEHLQQVGEHHGSVDTGGHHVILATKHTGNTLQNTHAWQHADATGRESLKEQATALTRARNEHHAEYHGIVHTYVVFIYVRAFNRHLILNFSDTNHGNVLYHENNGVLTNAHFVDWGLAKQAVKGANGEFNKATENAIVGFFSSYMCLLC